MREAFIRRNELTYVSRRQFEVIAVDTGEILYSDSHELPRIGPGNRVKNDREAFQCRARLQAFCLMNDVMLVDEPTLAERLIREINPVTINQFAAIGDIVASACEPKQGGGR